MDNFVQFLSDYYVWILAVLGIIIVTIIGFLVDSKQKRNKKENEISSANGSEVKTVEPLPEANIQSEVPVMEAKQESIPTNIDNILENNVNAMQMPSQNNISNIDSSIEQLKPIQPDNNNSNENLALSEQKPKIEPREVPIPTRPVNNMNEINNGIGPRPINPISINEQNISQPQYATPTNIQNGMQIQQPVQNMNSVNPNINNIPVNNGMQNQSSMQPNIQPTYQNNNQAVTAPNTNYNMPQQPMYQNMPYQMPNMQMQQPVNTIPTAPVQTPPVTPMQNQNMQPSNGNVASAQPSVPNIGISFVTNESDAQSTGNDNWQL